jgi:hypothetical protein
MLKNGSVEVDHAPTSHPANWSIERPPQELVPFIQSLDLDDLVRALKRSAWLYCHPLVQVQVQHFLELRIRWARGDDVPSEVMKYLQLLLSAHVAAVLPGHEVTLRPTPRRPGPKAHFVNPYPTSEEFTETIAGADLLSTFNDLRKQLTKKQHAFPRLRGTVAPASLQRLTDVCHEVLVEAGPMWSGRWKLRRVGTPGTLGKSNLRPFADLEDWWDIDLRPALTTFTQGSGSHNLAARRRLLRDGKAAAFSYVILGALLNITPAKIRDALANIRRKRRSRRP